MIDSNSLRTTRFYGAKFPGGLSSANPALVIDSDAIRNQVRVLSHTSIHAAAMINRDIDTTVDSGLMLSPECQHEVLGITPDEAERWNSNIAIRFDLWAQNRRSSANGAMNLYQAQRLWERCLAVDGENFVTLSYFSDPSLLSPLRFGALDASQIREAALTWTAGFLNIADGIVHNEWGEETAYKIWTQGPVLEMKTVPRVGRGGRIMMTHGYEPQFPGQTRGFSPLGVSIHDLEKLSVLALAETEKTINQSNIAFTVKSNSDNPAQDPFARVGAIGSPLGYGPAAAAFGNTPTPPEGAEGVAADSLEPVYTPVETSHTDIWKPGSVGIFNLPGKQELVPFQNTAPGTAFNAFVDAQVSYIAAASGQSVETVLMKFSNNYSASRATLILCWRIALQRRYNLACYHLDPIYEMWLSEEIAAGRVSAPGWLDPRMRAAWLRHRWQGSGLPVMDPTKSVKAAKEAIELGLTTMEDEAIEYNGSSAKANRAKIRQEFSELPQAPWLKKQEQEKTESQEEDNEEKEEAL
jgi:lambda family phage portal protein